MRWVRDTTGRFSRRPYYQQADLDERCERLLFDFLTGLYGQITLPVPNGALIKLLERDADALDLYADLHEGILGVTDFNPPRKPRVRIARELFLDSKRLHRLRFTFMHEYAHVWIHAPLYASAASARREDHECKDEEIEPASGAVDWMEWQAGYVAGALLMPLSRVDLVIAACLGPDAALPVAADSPKATDLKQRTSEAFAVSPEAAWVRLSQLAYLRDGPGAV
jgi:hypothetical protein